nr:hypothetical protein CFP56_52140 [Quercus suber]
MSWNVAQRLLRTGAAKSTSTTLLRLSSDDPGLLPTIHHFHPMARMFDIFDIKDYRRTVSSLESTQVGISPVACGFRTPSVISVPEALFPLSRTAPDALRPESLPMRKRQSIPPLVECTMRMERLLNGMISRVVAVRWYDL